MFWFAARAHTRGRRAAPRCRDHFEIVIQNHEFFFFFVLLLIVFVTFFVLFSG